MCAKTENGLSQEKHMKNFLKTAIFSVLMVLLLVGIQRVFTPSLKNLLSDQAPAETILEFEKMWDTDCIQAIFLGTSHVLWSVDPMQIYEKTGIPVYNMGTALQPLEGSYYFLKKAFQSQRPKYVFFDVSALFYTDQSPSDLAFHNILDPANWDSDKLIFAAQYASRFPKEKQAECFFWRVISTL